MHKTTLYIGSPTGMGKMDAHYKEIIRAWASEFCPDGYTLVWGEGGWRDTQEEPAILVVYTHADFPASKILHLKNLLHQQAILVETTTVDTRVI